MYLQLNWEKAGKVASSAERLNGLWSWVAQTEILAPPLTVASYFTFVL